MNTESMYTALGITPAVHRFGEEILAGLRARFDEIDRVAEYNQCKVIGAMQKNRVDATHFAATTGYGYNDAGRDNLERVYADCFHTEAALVRPQITCGTHALTVALSANLLPGDTLLSPVGAPYDTLEEVIGIRPSACSLKEYGVHYRQVDLLPDYGFDYPAIEQALRGGVKLVTIQRSKGYATRPTFSVAQIGELIAFCKRIDPNVICMVDNCYGEFVETIEPSDLGADMIVGSLIKNPGGGLAPIGGEPRAHAGVLSGLLPRADRDGRCAQGRGVRGERLRAARLPLHPERDGDAPRHHPVRRARLGGAHGRLLQGHSGGRARGQLRRPHPLGDAGLRLGGHHGRRRIHSGLVH